MKAHHWALVIVLAVGAGYLGAMLMRHKDESIKPTAAQEEHAQPEDIAAASESKTGGDMLQEIDPLEILEVHGEQAKLPRKDIPELQDRLESFRNRFHAQQDESTAIDYAGAYQDLALAYYAEGHFDEIPYLFEKAIQLEEEWATTDARRYAHTREELLLTRSILYGNNLFLVSLRKPAINIEHRMSLIDFLQEFTERELSVEYEEQERLPYSVRKRVDPLDFLEVPEASDRGRLLARRDLSELERQRKEYKTAFENNPHEYTALDYAGIYEELALANYAEGNFDEILYLFEKAIQLEAEWATGARVYAGTRMEWLLGRSIYSGNNLFLIALRRPGISMEKRLAFISMLRDVVQE